jgi:hypothetical protein
LPRFDLLKLGENTQIKQMLNNNDQVEYGIVPENGMKAE